MKKIRSKRWLDRIRWSVETIIVDNLDDGDIVNGSGVVDRMYEGLLVPRGKRSPSKSSPERSPKQGKLT